MLLSELRTLATKMARKRGLDEDAEQEAWVAAWRATEKSDNPRYIARSITNRLNGLHRESARTPVATSYDGLSFVSEDLAVDDNPPLNLDWAVRVLRDRVDTNIVLGILGGMSLAEVSRTWGRKRWDTYLQSKLATAWRESERE